MITVLLIGCGSFYLEVGLEPRRLTTSGSTPVIESLPEGGRHVEGATGRPTASDPAPANDPLPAEQPPMLKEALAEPGTDVPIDCADVTPFVPGCLAQERPAALGESVSFVGILPDSPVLRLAWNPQGQRLAYAVHNPDGWQGIIVRSLPDYAIEARWAVPGPFDIAWTPDGENLVFVFDRDEKASSIGMARLGSPVWHDLLPGDKAVLSTSRAKYLGEWLSERTILLRQGCGTACGSLYMLNVASGDLRPLVNAPDAPYADLFATQYAFSASRDWLATINWGRGLPVARVLPWPGPGEPIDPTAAMGGRYAVAMDWVGDTLLLYAFPEGEPETWDDPRPAAYFWQPDNTVQLISEAAHMPRISPSGDLLALLTFGGAAMDTSGRLTIVGDTPHLTLLTWPRLEWVATTPLNEGAMTAPDFWAFVNAPIPQWVGSKWVAICTPRGELLMVSTRGRAVTLLQVVDDQHLQWLGCDGVANIGQGANGDVTLLVQDQIWIVALQAH